MDILPLSVFNIGLLQYINLHKHNQQHGLKHILSRMSKNASLYPTILCLKAIETEAINFPQHINCSVVYIYLLERMYVLYRSMLKLYIHTNL